MDAKVRFYFVPYTVFIFIFDFGIEPISKIITSVWQNLASFDVRNPGFNDVSTIYSKLESLFDQSGAEIKTTASAN